MASDNQASPSPPPAIIRLEAAVNELEQILERFESTHRLMAEELAQTKAELRALRTLHETVSGRLDETIARLKHVVSEQSADDDET